MQDNFSDPDQWIEIGVIVSPHGLNGEVRVNSESDFPERFEKAGKRWILYPNQTIPQEIELLKGYPIPGKNIYVLKLEGVNYRDEAQRLKGAKLLVDKQDIPPLDEDEYHVSDLINLEVFHQETGENIGFVVNLFTAGHDLLEVQFHKQPIREEIVNPDVSKISRKSKIKKTKPKQNKPITVLIPFVNDIVPRVDLENKKIYINPPEGLLDVNITISN
jgi:16S rRNA processing protein RimM